MNAARPRSWVARREWAIMLGLKLKRNKARAQALLSMRLKSVTVDEIMYIATGYYHLRTGDFQMNMTNPPFPCYQESSPARVARIKSAPPPAFWPRYPASGRDSKRPGRTCLPPDQARSRKKGSENSYGSCGNPPIEAMACGVPVGR